MNSDLFEPLLLHLFCIMYFLFLMENYGLKISFYYVVKTLIVSYFCLIPKS